MGIPNIENLKPAPRKIPFLLKLQLVFGIESNQISWYYIVISFALFCVFLPNFDWKAIQYSGVPREYVQGEVYDSYLCGQPWMKYQTDPPVSQYANSYKFVKNNITYKGLSYSYSRCSIPPGTIVTIEYPHGNPEVSRIQGMRNSPLYDSESGFPWLWFLCFILAFMILIYNIRISFNWMKLLENGVVGHAKLEEDKDLVGIFQLPGIFRGKNEAVQFYPLVFRYQGLNRLTYKLKIMTIEPELLQDEELEQLVYDPKNPSNAVMLDTIPGGIIVDTDGNICPNNISVAFYFMIIPLAATMAAAYVILKYVL